MTEGALRLDHQHHGHVEWHGERTLELYCLTPGRVICAAVTEKDLAFIRLEPPEAT